MIAIRLVNRMYFIKVTFSNIKHLLQVQSQSISKVTLSYKYILPEDPLSSMENTLPQDDTIYFEWALRKWSHCSKPCGGGTQQYRRIFLIFNSLSIVLQLKLN